MSRKKMITRVVVSVLVGLSLVVGLTAATVSTTTKSSTTKSTTKVPAQIPVLCFHDIGTPSSVPGSIDYYSVTLANFTAEMAWLSKEGYAAITPAQYTAWLAGKAGTLPAKPVLITFDDAFTNDFTQATPVLQKYGFHATAFIATGYANGDYVGIDNGTNNRTDPNAYALWSTIVPYAADGTWTIQFHAGECGHAYMPYAPASCLTGLDRAGMTASTFQYYIWNFGQTSRAVRSARDGRDDGRAGEATVRGGRDSQRAVHRVRCPVRCLG